MTAHAHSASIFNPASTPDTLSETLLEESQLLQVSLHDYVGSLAEHQSAFLHWLDELSRRPTEVDRYQYKKIR
jgi:hypothetical protein